MSHLQANTTLHFKDQTTEGLQALISILRDHASAAPDECYPLFVSFANQSFEMNSGKEVMAYVEGFVVCRIMTLQDISQKRWNDEAPVLS